jgi:molecular chaperone DnaK
VAVDRARLGIDFGTSNTVAVLHLPGRGARPLVFDGSPLLPSAVCADATGHLLVGRDAWHAGMANPAGLEPNPKRHIDEDTLLLGAMEVPVEEVIAAVLRRVAAEATRVAGGAVGEAVLTYPASWAGARRERLRAAALQVFSHTDLVPEPAAAASYFARLAGARVPVGKCVVVYDLGAGTFDVSVVRSTPDGFEVLDSQGLPDAGGTDIDAAVVAYLAATFTARDTALWRRLASPQTPGDRRAARLLWDGVRGGKEMLSRATTTMLHVPLFDEEVPLGRDQLEELARPTLDRTVAATRSVLRATGQDKDSIAGLFLVGGASRMPLIGTLLHRALEIAPTVIDQPEVVVAEGSLATGAVPAPDVPASWPPAAPIPVPPLTRVRTRRLIAAAAAAVVLLAAVVTGLLLGGGGHRGLPASLAGATGKAGASAARSGPPSPSSSVDPCLVGQWRQTSYQITNKIDNIDTLFTGPGGATSTVTADGRSSTDYDTLTPMTATVKGVLWKHVVRGTITSHIRTSGGMIYSTDVVAHGSWQLLRNGRVNNSGTLSGSLESSHYTCSGDTFEQDGSFYNMTFVRTSTTP